MAVLTKKAPARTGTLGQGVSATPATAQKVIPFDQASKRGIEPGPSWEVTPGASGVNLGPVPVPSQGFLRAIEIDVSTVTNGVGGTLAPDAPWTFFERIREQDTNGNQLSDITGYCYFLDNIFGGVSGQPDPRVDPDYNASATNFSFQLLVTREMAPNGYGALANMSATQAYKLTLRVAPISQIWSTAPTTVPTFLIRTWQHYWQLPEEKDENGNPIIDEPPFSGSAQYRWLSQGNGTSRGFKLPINQVGNDIRQIILIGRRTTGARSDSVIPEPFQLRWDSDILLICGHRQLRKIARELVPNLVEWPSGVYPLLFNFGQGRYVGGSGVNSLLPTVTGTRLEVYGTAEEAGEVEVYVNDVSVAQINPALRPRSPGIGGNPPSVAPRVVGAR